MRLLIKIILTSCLWLLTASTVEAVVTPLPADQAFVFSVYINPTLSAPTKEKTIAKEVMAEWQIAPGYYLYTKRIHIHFEPTMNADIQLPQGEVKYGQETGQYEVFSGIISVPILLSKTPSQLTMHVDYQGCSQAGFCYPPMQRSFLLNFTDNTITPLLSKTTDKEWSSLLTDQNGIVTVLQSQHFGIVLLIFAGLGLLLALTPCVLPMIPILTSIIVGHRSRKHADEKHIKRAFFLSLAYVLGTAVTYALAGVLAAFLGQSLQSWLQQPWVIGLMSGVFVLLALSLFGCYELALPSRWQTALLRLNQRQRGGHYLSVFLMGMLSTLIVSPCVTAPLVGVLMYIAQSGDPVLGGSALFAMGIGMGIPLLLVGVSAGKWLPKSGPWLEGVKKIFGLLMLGMAVWLAARVIPVEWYSAVRTSHVSEATAIFTVVRDVEDL
ncbi:MAG TPA: protein-disulfide reductase DsbD, partial [Gammaproteobacteria bacterium]|nr:protein-disulfide reductase DsbD [Gammaproteobacteria bacterium]